MFFAFRKKEVINSVSGVINLAFSLISFIELLKYKYGWIHKSLSWLQKALSTLEFAAHDSTL